MNLNNSKKFLKDYQKDILKLIDNHEYETQLLTLKEKIIKIKKKKKKLIFVGNGGSAATASHASVDFTKNAKITSINFNESDLITCFSNDYGYENWVKEALKYYADKDDLLFIFSCSGESKNLIQAIKFANYNKINVVTFTGKKKNNSLKKKNKKGINFFVKSQSYNQIEIIHHYLILALVDLCIGKINYSSKM